MRLSHSSSAAPWRTARIQTSRFVGPSSAGLSHGATNLGSTPLATELLAHPLRDPSISTPRQIRLTHDGPTRRPESVKTGLLCCLQPISRNLRGTPESVDLGLVAGLAVEVTVVSSGLIDQHQNQTDQNHWEHQFFDRAANARGQ